MKSKTIISFITILLLTGLTTVLFANPIDREKAKTIAKNFYLQVAKNNNLPDITLSLVFTEKNKDISNLKGNKPVKTPVFFIFNVNQNDGYVIITADDDVIPILGYSLSGNYTGTNLPPALRKLLENYKKQIEFVIFNSLKADKEIQDKWNRLKKGEPMYHNKDTKSVNPLLTTTWNQNNYYNDMCPYNYLFFQHTVTGCTATAMAQIMKYWNYPYQGRGFHSYTDDSYGTQTANFTATTYNWSAMPNNVTSSNDAVATLMYHCGVSVEMDYDIALFGGSNSWVISDNGQHPYCAENAFKTYFGYNQNTIQGLKRENYNTPAWKNLLKEELNSSRPIQYAGFESGGGHTFVCDGYDYVDFFHMNWGWGGQSDGYFSLDDLTPGSNNFNNGQQALIGIQPGSGGYTPNIDLYSSITITPNPINFYNLYTVNADVINSGNTNFNGDYCAALFNENGLFVDYVEILSTGSNPLPPGYHYTGGLTFSNDGLMMVPGNYIVGIYYRETDGEWILAGNTNYSNPINTSVSNPYNPLEQYSDIIATPSTFVQGASANVNVNFYNTNNYTYYGQYKASLYDFEGNFIQTIDTYNETNGLPSGYIYSSPYINFSTTSITTEPGTYLLSISEKETGSDSWYFVGGSYYLTPIYINVVAPPLSPDNYEPNNTEAASFELPITFSGNTAIKNTAGSNIHLSDDVDYYEINLDQGYDYVVTARLHDSYNSGNGQTYTCDVLFAYNYQGNWSDYYDDIMPNTISVLDGGTIMFFVGPYFAGETGTYLLDLSITRSMVLPDPAGPITGLTVVCQGQESIIYSVPVIPNATTYIWTLPSGATGNSSSNNIIVNYSSNAVSGNISVMGHNAGGDGLPSSLYITVNQTPQTPTITLNDYVLTSSSSTGNQWYNGSGAINGATSQQYVVSTTDDYYDIVSSNSCSSEMSNTIHVVINGIADTEEIIQQILIYPNPVNDELIIDLKDSIEVQSFEIINSFGKIIYSSNIIKTAKVHTLHFPNGAYLIRFKTPNSFLLRKFIKQ